MTVAAIGYLRIESTDSTAMMAFGTDILGLMDAAREDARGALFYAWTIIPGSALWLNRGHRTGCSLSAWSSAVLLNGRPAATGWPPRA